MIPPSSLAKLVVGYLEEEGLQKTAELFHQENRDNLIDEPHNPFTNEPSLKEILEDYVTLKQSVAEGNPNYLVMSLWKNLDVLIGQLKYHTISQSDPQKTNKAQRKNISDKFNKWRKRGRPGPKFRSTRSNDTRTTNSPVNVPDSTQTIQPVCVTGMLTPVGSPSQWQSVAIHKSGSYVPIHQQTRINKDTGIRQGHTGSSRMVRDQNLCGGIKQGQTLDIDRNQNGSMRFDKDQNRSNEDSSGSNGMNRDQNGLLSTDISDHQRSTTDDQLKQDVIIDSSDQFETNKSLLIRDQHRDQVKVPNSRARSSSIEITQHATNQGTSNQQWHSISSNPHIAITPSLLSASDMHVCGIGSSQTLPANNIDTIDTVCVDGSEDVVVEVHNDIQTSKGCGVVPYKPILGMVDLTNSGNSTLATKSPKRKGHPPKKRQAPNPSPTKILPLDSYPAHEPDCLQQLVEGDKITDATMPLLLGALLNTPILQEKLAENINKIVGSTKTNDIIEEILTESTVEKPSMCSVHDDASNEQNFEIPVDDILSLLEADPVFDSLFSMIDGSKTASPCKESQPLLSCSLSGPLPTSTACSTDSLESQSTTSVVTESLLLLASSPSRPTVSTTVTPSSSETTTPSTKPLTPDKNTTTVDISNTETEVHVRVLKFSNQETPEQEKEKPKKISTSKRKLISPYKRIRCPKKHKKKETTPKRKLLLPNISAPNYVQSVYKVLDTIPYSNTHKPTNITNTNMAASSSKSLNDNKSSKNARESSNRSSGKNFKDNSNGVKKTGCTVLQMLQDAAALQQIQGIQTCSSVVSHAEPQSVFTSPMNSGNNLQGNMTTTAVASFPQPINMTGNDTLYGNTLMNTTPSHFVIGNATMQTGQVTQPQFTPQPGGILYNATVQQNNIMQHGELPSMCTVAAQTKTLLSTNQFSDFSTLNTGHHVSYNLMGGAGSSTSGYLGPLAERRYSQAIAKLAASANRAVSHQNDITTLISATGQSNMATLHTTTTHDDMSKPSKNISHSYITAPSNKAFRGGNINQLSMPVTNGETPSSCTIHDSILSSNNHISTHESQPTVLAQNDKTLLDQAAIQHPSFSSSQAVSLSSNNQTQVTSNYHALQTEHSSNHVSPTTMSSSTNPKMVSTTNYHQSMNMQYQNTASHSLLSPTSNQALFTSKYTDQSTLTTHINPSSDKTLVNTAAQERDVALVKSLFNQHETALSSSTLDNQSYNSVTSNNDLGSMNTSDVTTPQKQLLNILAPTPGQSSTESSPASKTAEMCVSSFCNISSEGATHLTMQNNAFPTYDISHSYRTSSNLSKDQKHEGKRLTESERKSEQEIEKDYGSEKESMCPVREGDRVLPSTPAVNTQTGEDTAAIRQGVKRSGGADLKENKPKKSRQYKGSKKSKSKGGLPKNFDVEKFLSKLHYVEK